MAQLQERRTIKTITQAEYERSIIEISRELNQPEPTMQPEVQEFVPLLKDFKIFWKLMDGTHRKLLLVAMFDRLYFDHEHRLRKVALRRPFERTLNLEDTPKLLTAAE